MPSYTIRHLTRYTYEAPVTDGASKIMVYPLADERLIVHAHTLTISRNPEVEIFTDYFQNQVGVFFSAEPHTELLIESTLAVTTRSIQFPMDELPAEQQWQHLTSLRQDAEFLDFLTPEPLPLSDGIRETLSALLNFQDKPLKNALILSEYVYDHFSYQQGVTSIETPTEEIWRLKAGVCQDFAHMLLAMLRMFGLPARYVSGYICPKDETVRGAGATHAWVEAYIPFYGWLGLDPTNNCIVSDGHVRVAIGRHFSDCTPVKGTYKGGGAHRLDVAVHVENGLQSGSPRPAAGPTPLDQPAYTYQVVEPAREASNSYRRYLEMQQQQQQQ